MKLASAFQTPSQHPCHHASAEEYKTFVYAFTHNEGEREHLLSHRRCFVRYYPDLQEWFQAPLAERIGSPNKQGSERAKYQANFYARRYLIFLALPGYLRLDWEWILAIRRINLWEMLDQLHFDGGLTELIEEAVGLGYVGERAKSALRWTLGRLFLHTGQFHAQDIRESHLESFSDALLHAHENPDIVRFYTSVEQCRRETERLLGLLFTSRVVLYHRGQIATEPQRNHPLAQREALKPHMETTVARYVAARSLTDRPSTVRHIDADLRHFISWIAQAYPQLETFAEVTRDHVLEFADALNTMRNPRTQQPFAISTKRNILSRLSMLFQDGLQWEWKDVPDRPLILVGDLPKQPRHLPRYIPDEELGRLMLAIRDLRCPYQRAALLIARWSGARRGEIRRLSFDCLDSYPDGTPRLRIPVGKTYKERMVPTHPEAAEAIQMVQKDRRGERGLRDKETGKVTRFLFVQRGRLLSATYLFDFALEEACRGAGLVTADGKAFVTAHRFRHTVGTQLTNRGARLRTVMKMLGHDSAQMALVYAQMNDQEVLKDYQAVLGPGAIVAGPAAEALRSGELGAEAVDWLKTNYLKTELELGRCLRLPQEGPCECDLYLNCAKFVTTSAYAPRLRHRRKVEMELIADAIAHGWQREVERHQCTVRRIEQLLTDLREPIDGPEATD